jgi:tRNA 2-thiouridine synthesizing protein A
MGEPVVIDARGLTCPLPILRAKKGLRLVEPGEVLTVLATDPSSVKDFGSFCRQTGHELVAMHEEDGGVYRYVIRRSA